MSLSPSFPSDAARFVGRPLHQESGRATTPRGGMRGARSRDGGNGRRALRRPPCARPTDATWATAFQSRQQAPPKPGGHMHALTPRRLPLVSDSRSDAPDPSSLSRAGGSGSLASLNRAAVAHWQASRVRRLHRAELRDPHRVEVGTKVIRFRPAEVNDVDARLASDDVIPSGDSVSALDAVPGVSSYSNWMFGRTSNRRSSHRRSAARGRFEDSTLSQRHVRDVGTVALVSRWRRWTGDDPMNRFVTRPGHCYCLHF